MGTSLTPGETSRHGQDGPSQIKVVQGSVVFQVRLKYAGIRSEIPLQTVQHCNISSIGMPQMSA